MSVDSLQLTMVISCVTALHIVSVAIRSIHEYIFVYIWKEQSIEEDISCGQCFKWLSSFPVNRWRTPSINRTINGRASSITYCSVAFGLWPWHMEGLHSIAIWWMNEWMNECIWVQVSQKFAALPQSNSNTGSLCEPSGTRQKIIENCARSRSDRSAIGIVGKWSETLTRVDLVLTQLPST